MARYAVHLALPALTLAACADVDAPPRWIEALQDEPPLINLTVSVLNEDPSKLADLFATYAAGALERMTPTWDWRGLPTRDR